MDIPHRGVISAFARLETQFAEFLEVVPLEQAHFDLWSPVLATIMLESCSQLDSLWKLELRETGRVKPNAKITDYFTLFGPVLSGQWCVIWADDGQKLEPFIGWQPGGAYAPLPWWQAYNDLKHDRWEHKRRATLIHASHALAGLFLAIINASAMDQGLLDGIWVNTDWNKQLVVEFLRKGTDGDQWPEATIESRLFSYAIGCNHPDFSKHATSFYHASPHFVQWLNQHYNARIPRMQ